MQQVFILLLYFTICPHTHVTEEYRDTLLLHVGGL